jgi:hypothetical protein
VNAPSESFDMFAHRAWRVVQNAIYFTAAILVSALAAHAGDIHWSPFWDALAERSDAKVIDGVNRKGEPTRRIELSSGVSFNLERHGDQITSMGSDTSGLGAVQCSWEIYVAVRSYVEACLPGEDQGFEVDLDHAIDRTNDFIVENSLVPVTKPQLQDAVEQRSSSRMLSSSANDWFKRPCADSPMTIASRGARRTLSVPSPAH